MPDVLVRPPLVLRLEGSFATDREQARQHGADAVSMRFGDVHRWFSAREVRTVGGDPPVSGRSVLNALAPYDPNLIVVGQADLLRALEDAAPGTPVRVDGVVDRAARTFLLREVVVGHPEP